VRLNNLNDPVLNVLRKSQNRGASLTAGIIAITANQFYVNNNMSSYKLLLLTQILGKVNQYFGLNVKHPNFKTDCSQFKYHSTNHILLLERTDTPNSVNELQNLNVTRHSMYWE